MNNNMNLTPTSADSAVIVQQENTVLLVTSHEELENKLKLMEKRAGDLVNTQTVRSGYIKGGLPASLAFQHLNVMTSSRLKKQFPNFNRNNPLMRILWAEGKLIVGEEILNKYTARLTGETYDYIKAINKRFKDMFTRIGDYERVVQRLGCQDENSDIH